MRRNESLKVGDISSELADKEEVPLPKMNEVKVRLNRVQKKRARNSDSDSDQEVASWEMKPVRRQRNVRNLRSINYRSLSQGILINRLNGQEQKKDEEMEAEMIRKKIVDDDGVELKEQIKEAEKLKKKEAKEAMIVKKSEQKSMATEQTSLETCEKSKVEKKSLDVVLSEFEEPASPESPAHEVENIRDDESVDTLDESSEMTLSENYAEDNMLIIDAERDEI